MRFLAIALLTSTVLAVPATNSKDALLQHQHKHQARRAVEITPDGEIDEMTFRADPLDDIADPVTAAAS